MSKKTGIGNLEKAFEYTLEESKLKEKPVETASLAHK